jgi:hypothetical protein
MGDRFLGRDYRAGATLHIAGLGGLGPPQRSRASSKDALQLLLRWPFEYRLFQ